MIEGVAKVDTQGVDWLRHKAEDAGRSEEEIAAITEPIVSVTLWPTGDSGVNAMHLLLRTGLLLPSCSLVPKRTRIRLQPESKCVLTLNFPD